MIVIIDGMERVVGLAIFLLSFALRNNATSNNLKQSKFIRRENRIFRRYQKVLSRKTKKKECNAGYHHGG